MGWCNSISGKRTETWAGLFGWFFSDGGILFLLFRWVIYGTSHQWGMDVAHQTWKSVTFCSLQHDSESKAPSQSNGRKRWRVIWLRSTNFPSFCPFNYFCWNPYSKPSCAWQTHQGIQHHDSRIDNHVIRRYQERGHNLGLCLEREKALSSLDGTIPTGFYPSGLRKLNSWNLLLSMPGPGYCIAM